MKQKRRTSLSPLQRKRLLRISFCVLGAALLWILFAPGRGFFFLQQQNKQLAALTAEHEALIVKNRELEEDVARLQRDEAYLEQVAREKHGMLKENEMVFDFAKEKKKK